MKKAFIATFAFLLMFSGMVGADQETLKGNTLFTAVKKILVDPSAFTGQYVSIKATFFGWKDAPGKPPVTRSDWVAKDEDGSAIYCTGVFPSDLKSGQEVTIGRIINVLGKVLIDDTGRPYIVVSEALAMADKPEMMVSVAQILFDPIGMRGQNVGLLGVLTKGFGVKGNRMYLLADPTGAITLERLPKLYPKGTILRIKGTVGSDENGLPQLKNVEIIFAKN